MSEHSQEDLDSSLIELEKKLPNLATLQNTFWKSSRQAQALLSEAGVPNGFKTTSAERRFTPESLTYVRLIILRGTSPDKIASDLTIKVKVPGKDLYTLKIASNNNYAYAFIQNFCDWFEISSTKLLLKPQITKLEVYGSTPAQLINYSTDIEEIVELKRTIEEYKSTAKSEYLNSKKLLADAITTKKLLEIDINTLIESQDFTKSESEALDSKLEETKSTLQRTNLELSHSEKKLVETKNNSEQLSKQVENQNKNIADLNETLAKLTSDKNLISDEYGPYVKEGNSQATTYSWLITLPLLAIIFSTYQVYVGASKILSAEYSSATDVLAAFILRIPFAAIFGLAIFYSWKLAYTMIQKVFKIHSDRLTLAKLLVVARETVHSSAKNLSISDYEKFQEQTALKIEVLKSHMARDLSENFTYKPVPISRAATTDPQSDAVNDDFVSKEESAKP